MVNNAIKTIQSDDFMVSLSSRSDFAAKILGEPGGVSPRTSRVIRSRPGANAHRLARERVGQECPTSKGGSVFDRKRVAVSSMTMP